MSQHSSAQVQYHGSICYPPTKMRYPMLRPIPKTEGTDGHPSHTPPPMQYTIPPIQVTSPPSRKICHETQSHPMPTHPLPPLQQHWPSSEGWAPAAGYCPSSNSRSQYYNGHSDATRYAHSMDLPPLKSEPAGSRRPSPRSFSSDDSDSVSVDELDEEESGLPHVLSKFKLDRPQTPLSECSSFSRPPTQSPELMSTMLPIDGRQPSSTLAVPIPLGPMARHIVSDRRKVVRQIRRTPSPMLRDPVHTAALDNVLHGTHLADITVPQLRTLIKKLPIPTHLDGKWEEFAIYEMDPENPKKDHRCTFDPLKCNYSGKKQLVQRHIEGVHLKMKQYKCPYCESAFHQETCAITHVSSIHLKVFPFQCNFCERRFNDVARRHRHYQEAHNYVSKKTRRTSRLKKSQEVEPSDST